MNTDFSKLDKSDFKCLETEDGAVYYGQVVQILPANVEVPADKMAGFQPRAAAEESLRKSQMTELSGAGSPGEAQDPLVVADIEKVDEELAAQLVTVRHGNGIQIQADKTTKYAGQWRFGARHGDGHLVSSDGSEYRGNLHYGKFDGYGQFSWPKQESETVAAKYVGHCYVGQWKMGLMHGTGEFQHAEGQVYKPDFCNSLFHLQDGLFINPFDTQAEVEAQMKRIERRKADEEADAKKQAEKCSVKRVVGVGQYHGALDQIRESGRTPLVISSLQFPVPTADMIAQAGVDPAISNNAFLKTLGRLCDGQKGNASAFIAQLRGKYRQDYYEALAQGHPWVLNILLDDEAEGEEAWPHVYEPDIDMFFGKYGLPQEVWKGKSIFDSVETCPDEIKAHLERYYEAEYQRIQEEAMAQQADMEARSKHSRTEDGMSFKEVEVDRDAILRSQLFALRQELLVQLTVFSRFKIDQALEDDELLAQLKDKFGHSVPLKHVDIVLVQSWEELAPEEQQDPLDESADRDQLAESGSALRTTDMEKNKSTLESKK